LLSESIDADKAVVIAREFFKHSFAPFDIVNTDLQDDIWFVKGHVLLFGVTSNRILTINSKTGRIISCE